MFNRNELSRYRHTHCEYNLPARIALNAIRICFIFSFVPRLPGRRSNVTIFHDRSIDPRDRLCDKIAMILPTSDTLSYCVVLIDTEILLHDELPIIVASSGNVFSPRWSSTSDDGRFGNTRSHSTLFDNARRQSAIDVKRLYAHVVYEYWHIEAYVYVYTHYSRTID